MSLARDFVGLVAAISLTASAESCLDVIEYGYHRYSHRIYETREIQENHIYMISNGIIYYYRDVEQRQECVCGAQRWVVISQNYYTMPMS